MNSKKPRKTKALVVGWIIIDKRFGPLFTTFSPNKDTCISMYETKFGMEWNNACQHGAICDKVSLVKGWN